MPRMSARNHNKPVLGMHLRKQLPCFWIILNCQYRRFPFLLQSYDVRSLLHAQVLRICRLLSQCVHPHIITTVDVNGRP